MMQFIDYSCKLSAKEKDQFSLNNPFESKNVYLCYDHHKIKFDNDNKIYNIINPFDIFYFTYMVDGIETYNKLQPYVCNEFGVIQNYILPSIKLFKIKWSIFTSDNDII